MRVLLFFFLYSHQRELQLIMKTKKRLIALYLIPYKHLYYMRKRMGKLTAQTGFVKFEVFPPSPSLFINTAFIFD
jgi:hypothetical protein